MLAKVGTITPTCMVCVFISIPLLELGGPVWGICKVQTAERLSSVLGNPTGPNPHSTYPQGSLEHFQ